MKVGKKLRASSYRHNCFSFPIKRPRSWRQGAKFFTNFDLTNSTEIEVDGRIDYITSWGELWSVWKNRHNYWLQQYKEEYGSGTRILRYHRGFRQ